MVHCQVQMLLQWVVVPRGLVLRASNNPVRLILCSHFVSHLTANLMGDTVIKTGGAIVCSTSLGSPLHIPVKAVFAWHSHGFILILLWCST